jgi:hypothetical protein
MAIENMVPPARFFMNSHYAFGFSCLSISSDEERLLGGALRNAIADNLDQVNCAFDIGCADGRLARNVFSAANELVCWEPNPILYSFAVSNLAHLEGSVRCINSSFSVDDEQDLGKGSCILLSHVLYHIREERWHEVFLAVKKILTSQGICVVVLWNKDSEARMISQSIDVGRWLCDAEQFIKVMSGYTDLGLQITSVVDLDISIQPHTLDMAHAISQFLVGHAKSDTPETKEAFEKLDQKLLSSGINNSQSIIVLRRL